MLADGPSEPSSSKVNAIAVNRQVFSCLAEETRLPRSSATENQVVSSGGCPSERPRGGLNETSDSSAGRSSCLFEVNFKVRDLGAVEDSGIWL